MSLEINNHPIRFILVGITSCALAFAFHKPDSGIGFLLFLFFWACFIYFVDLAYTVLSILILGIVMKRNKNKKSS